MESVADVGQQSNVTGALDVDEQRTLRERAGAGHAAGDDLRALADILAQTGNILVIDMIDTINAEAANLLAAAALRAAGTAFLSLKSHGSNPPYRIVRTADPRRCRRSPQN